VVLAAASDAVMTARACNSSAMLRSVTSFAVRRAHGQFAAGDGGINRREVLGGECHAASMARGACKAFKTAALNVG